jgi:hypothetical protein
MLLFLPMVNASPLLFVNYGVIVLQNAFFSPLILAKALAQKHAFNPFYSLFAFCFTSISNPFAAFSTILPFYFCVSCQFFTAQRPSLVAKKSLYLVGFTYCRCRLICVCKYLSA